MKTKGKAWHLVVTVLLILAFVYTAFFGVSAKYGDVTTTYIKGAKDIRFGVDIKGGVNVTFVPSEDYDATEEQLEAAQLVIENRLVALNVTDYELYVDPSSDSLILEFPWQSGETDFDPESAIEEIGTTAYLTFREGSSADGDLILDGSMIESAAAQYGPVSNGGASEYFVSLKFTDDGAKAFGDATTKLAASGGTISIWLDDENVSTASVNAAITDGSAIITSSASNPFTQEDVVKMARQINSGSLPFALTVDSYSTISPSLGENSLSAMVLAGVIAFALIVVLMTALYRLPGFLACIALAGQVAATLAFVSGYFPVFESFTLTLPGIAGIILAIGMGVDANVITAERIKEELRSGKSLDGALKSGFARGLTPIIDGNVTIVIVAIVLMGAFGPSDGFFAKALHFVFFAFGPSTAGTIYAFGYTLLTGVLLNFVFGIFATRTMIRGAASTKALRDPRLYGADAPGKTPAEKKQVNFVGLRKRFLTFSACLMAASVSLVPEISEACAVRQDTRISKTVSATFLFTSVIGFGAAALFAVFPHEICYIVYDRAALGQVLFPLAFLCPLLYAQTTLHGLLNGLGEQLFLFRNNILSSCISIAVIWFCMPAYGVAAFLGGWFLSLLFSVSCSLHRLWKRTAVLPSCSACFLKPLLAGTAAGLLTKYCIRIFAPSKLLFLGSLCGMGVLYLLFLFLLGCLDKRMLSLLFGKK